jgi:hypothetical protein
VWVADEDLTLYIDTSKPEAKGTGIVKKEYGGKHSDAHRLTVRTEDIHEWLLQHTCPDDEIVVKMDIEGAEYPVRARAHSLGWHRGPWVREAASKAIPRHQQDWILK